MNYTFSQASEVASLVVTFLDTQLSQQLKSNPTAKQSSDNGKQTGYYLPSLFSETSESLTETSGEERSMSSLVGFPAPTSALPGGEQESKGNTLDSGPRCLGSFVRFNPDSYSWRTRQHSLFGGLEEFSGTWPQWGLMLNGECWELTSVDTTIEGNASGLLPTPIATDWKGGTTSRRKDNGKERYDQWRDYVKLKYGMTYPHPTHSEVRMGFPEGWSELKPLEMPKFQKWQQQCGGF